MACKIDFHEVIIDSPIFRYENKRWEKVFLQKVKKWKFLAKFLQTKTVQWSYKCNSHEVNILLFRLKLEEQEQEIENLEQKLDRILKLATASCDSGRQFVVNQRWVMSVKSE